jgi:hypothetical protein
LVAAPPGDHKYVVAPDAVVETEAPEHEFALDGVTVMVGVVVTVTVTVFVALHAPVVPVTVYIVVVVAIVVGELPVVALRPVAGLQV